MENNAQWLLQSHELDRILHSTSGMGGGGGPLGKYQLA